MKIILRLPIKSLCFLIQFFLFDIGAFGQSSIFIDAYNKVGIHTNTPASGLELGGSFQMKTTTIESDITLSASHAIVFCNNTEAINITLPSAVDIPGRTYYVKKINTGVVTVTTTAGQRIDGNTVVYIGAKYALMQFVSNGNDWFIMGNTMQDFKQ